jgi:hypothetical protein
MDASRWSAVCGECGKRVWGTKEAARGAIRRMIDQGSERKRGATNLRPYRACAGDGYHVGHGRQVGPNLNDPRLRFMETWA